MTTTLRTVAEQLELRRPSTVPSGHDRLRVADEHEALRLLRRFGAASRVDRLRKTLEEARPGYDVRALSDATILGEVAACLARGRLQAFRLELRAPGEIRREEVEAPPVRAAKRLTWVELVLKDEKGRPVPDARYVIRLADESTREGRLDDRGFAKESEIPPGPCKVAFPDIDAEEWRLA